MVPRRNPAPLDLSLYWRLDGKPVWRDEKLIAREGVKTSATHEDARKFLQSFARNLGLTGDTIDEAYEDPGEAGFLKEARLPDNVDPANSELADAEARSRIARVFERGLTNPPAMSFQSSAGMLRPQVPG